MEGETKPIKIDITSTLGEKSLDIVKEFADKLIMPSIEEAGLLIKTPVTLWRFKNEINVLAKAKAYCEAKGISIKTIPVKLLCPLLEMASLEEDDCLQDKWATLLGNMVDSEQNIETHVFPYLLSQISTNEFNFIQEFVNQHLYNLKTNEHIINKNPAVDVSSLREFEVANLIRLGLIKERTTNDLLYVMKNPNSKASEGESIKYRRVVTELGVLFIMACNEKGN